MTELGDDAHSSMSAADVGTVLNIAHTARFDPVWIAGGWGVDALVGRQTRIHSDLDLAVDVTRMALDHLLQAFGRHGYVVEADWRPSRVAVVAGARQVDLHPLVFDAQGTGWQANVECQVFADGSGGAAAVAEGRANVYRYMRREPTTTR